ncbi:MAG: PatB family C-S lyase [Prevotella sp.]|nr:PatB family C-S lyase [Prevotella sp.]
MPTYNFDKPVDRTGSGDYKHCVLEKIYGRNDLLPLWVADMDFETPQFITDALRKRLDHSLFGYTITPPELWPTVQKWITDHHQWETREEWYAFIPGIVKGIGMVINVFTKPGDSVVIMPPVYHPFRLVPEGNGRKVVNCPLRPVGNTYEIDFDLLAEVCDESCRLLILSNPHNPAGIVWPREVLQQLAHFCHSRGIIVISDEIHCDMALFGHRHIPFASVSEEAAACSITFGAPSKTFNIAGIVSSYAIVPNDELREKFFKWLEANEMDAPTIFSPIATMAAFSQGEEWRQQMLAYVEENIRFVETFCHEKIPQLKPLRPQASFLVWLDCRELGLSHDELVDLFVNKARLALNDGAMFGPGGEGFMRLNVGTQRSLLQEALSRLKEAIEHKIS